MIAPLRLEPYYSVKHYALISAWWKARGDEALPADALPETGAVVTRNSRPIAMCSVWLSNSKMAFLAYPISAPGLSPRVAYEAINLAIEGAVDIAKLARCKVIYAITTSGTIDRILTKNVGFTRSTPHFNLFLKLDHGVSHDTLVGHDFTETKE